MEWAWLIPIYGFLAFVFIALLRENLPDRGRFISILAILAGFITFCFVLNDLIQTGVSQYHFKIDWFTAGKLDVAWGILVDPLTVVMLGLVTFVALLVQVYSLGYMKGDKRLPWYFAVHSLFAAAMLTLILADNLLLMYFAWELVGLCSYLLIGFWFERPAAAEASKKAFVTTRIGDIGLLIGIILLVVNTGTFDILEILNRVTSPVPGEELSNLLVTSSSLLIFAGAMGKSAQFPLHVWLPDAMEGPTPVSALIHAATMVAAGVFLVARLFPLFEASDNALLVVSIVGIVTALVGALFALTSTDLKRILAYSTMSHLGFMMLALGAGGYTAAIFHLTTHGIAKAMLFMAAGSVMHALNDETDIRKMGGLRNKMPITAITFSIGALALSGIPPLSAFWSKDEILLAVEHGLNPIFLIGFLISVVLSAIYMARVTRIAFYGHEGSNVKKAHESPSVMTFPLLILAGLSLIVGFIAIPIGAHYDGFASFLFAPGHKPHGFEINILWTLVSVILATGGFSLGWWLYSSRLDIVENIKTRFQVVHKLLDHKLYLDDLYQWLIDNIAMRLGAAIALFDRKVVNDNGVNRPGFATFKTGKILRGHITGLFADYGITMVAGAIALGVGLILWVRW
tara:strand:+ start:1612 stop:3495 length:1884 start_codon:yes stop_codon:yes gene_type:complete